MRIGKFIILFCMLLTHLSVFAEEQSHLKDISCQITKESDGKIEGFCSGSFISPNTFVTAGHCIESINNTSYVRCLNSNKKFKVITSLPHPDYNENDMYTQFFNDIAILKTEPNNLIKKFPNIPSRSINLQSVDKNSCSYIGFSSKYCNFETGKGCHRKSKNLFVPKVELVDILKFPEGKACRIKTGENCILTKYNILPTETTPLMWGLSNNEKSWWGDSGAGIICQIKGTDYLMGVLTAGMIESTIISSINKRKFLKESLKY